MEEEVVHPPPHSEAGYHFDVLCTNNNRFVVGEINTLIEKHWIVCKMFIVKNIEILIYCVEFGEEKDKKDIFTARKIINKINNRNM